MKLSLKHWGDIHSGEQYSLMVKTLILEPCGAGFKIWPSQLKWTRAVCLWASYFPHLWASQEELEVKNPPANAGDIRDMGSIPGSGRSPGGGHGDPLQYSRVENPMDRGAWWPTVHRVTQSRTRLNWLSSMHASSSVNGEMITSLGGLVSVYSERRWVKPSA